VTGLARRTQLDYHRFVAMKAVPQQTTRAIVASTTYWALWGGPDLDEVRTVFRVKRGQQGAHVERFDPVSKLWLEGPRSLLRYVVGGEVGADRISQSKAERLAEGLTAALR
jgi:hypothetical protein